MDFNSGSVPPNQLPNSMPMPPYPLPQDSQKNKEKLALQQFWHQQFTDIQSNEANQRQVLPVRVKKIMKAHQGIKMISSEAPMVLAKACEVFIQELTFRAWIRAEANKKRTLQHCDIAMAIKKDKVFNFLKNVANCGHDHDAIDSLKEANAGNRGPGFMENPMMNMAEMVATNQQFPQHQMLQTPNLPADQPQIMQPTYLPPNQSKFMQPQYLLTDQFETMQPQYLPSDQSEILQPSYLPSDQSMMMPQSYLPSNQSQIMQSYLPSDQSKMMQPDPYLPCDQSQTMQPYLSSDQYEIMQPDSYLPSDQSRTMQPYLPSDQSEMMQPDPSLPSDQSQIIQFQYFPYDQFPYNFHPK